MGLIEEAIGAGGGWVTGPRSCCLTGTEPGSPGRGWGLLTQDITVGSNQQWIWGRRSVLERTDWVEGPDCRPKAGGPRERVSFEITKHKGLMTQRWGPGSSVWALLPHGLSALGLRVLGRILEW